MKGILVYFHCGTNAGFAIERLERVFLELARRLVGGSANIHFGYPSLERGSPKAFASDAARLIQLDPRTNRRAELERIEGYVRAHGIEFALGFDQPPGRPVFSALRRGGVRKIVSYWGAPMSSIHRGPRLWLKRLQVGLDRHKPDRFVFESEAMRETGVRGRGISRDSTDVVYLGVNPQEFRPAVGRDTYAHRSLGIPESRRIVYYSGHMEPRKGVDVIVKAAVMLVGEFAVKDVHFVLCGNRPGEADRFLPLYEGTAAAGHITFAGYRSDVAELMRCATLGAIASTGWDSFTMTAVELAASGIPLVVSDLQGLSETVDPDSTGVLFPPGDVGALARTIRLLLSDPSRLEEMGRKARARVLSRFTTDRQLSALEAVCRGS